MVKKYRVRLLELRKKVNDLIEAELRELDQDEIREAKEDNGRRVVAEPITKVEPEKE